ncbi:hypothetical protein [Variovorax sp. PBL-E5]|uniref:hypothetical protein n=1 Tax=Variovorax sp. PBL-E5 TaxID=434014 RepID=UPI001316F55A|nr:hypothetical protein [Variovorax sp. PBL-E5]VTU37046.1 hypothetical protein E5CHR_04470 [Variovorax sp. PBL-E5]
MTEPDRFCASCAHCTQRIENGADWQACMHQPEGAPAPLMPHQQRTAPADEAANFCGIEGIFWEQRA